MREVKSGEKGEERSNFCSKFERQKWFKAACKKRKRKEDVTRNILLRRRFRRLLRRRRKRVKHSNKFSNDSVAPGDVCEAILVCFFCRFSLSVLLPNVIPILRVVGTAMENR